MRIAVLSYHTCPLATLGGKDAGGMNVYVRDLALFLGREGIELDVFTRSQDEHVPHVLHDLGYGNRVAHIPAGPEYPLPKKQLAEYLRGKRRVFDLPLLMSAPTFTARVLAEVESIPFGETRSYGEVAELIGSPRAARAIGQAVGSNPLPIVIPCHRVLAARRKLGGFGGGHDALDWKRYLLALEESDWVE